jgi:hypothetical protein
VPLAVTVAAPAALGEAPKLGEAEALGEDAEEVGAATAAGASRTKITAAAPIAPAARRPERVIARILTIAGAVGKARGVALK